MKKSLRILGPVLMLVLVAAIVLFFSSVASRHRHTVACKGIEITILDSAETKFISKAGVKDALAREYGYYVGQRIDSVNLAKIERIVDAKSAVLKSEAYVTVDGILHVEVRQKEPAIKFIGTSGSFYADRDGNIFPLQARPKEGIPVVEGNIPVRVESGYCGPAKTQREKDWIAGVIDMEEFIASSRTWRQGVKTVLVDGEGDIVLKMTQGKERFIFGRPTDIEAKFRAMEDYYKYVVPAHDTGHYSSVSLKTPDRLVCRK